MLDHDINEALGTPKATNCGPCMVRQIFWKGVFMELDGEHPKEAHHILEAPLHYAQIILANSIFAMGEANN